MQQKENSDLQWKIDMEADAAKMSSYDFADKYGKYNLGVWDRINVDKQPNDFDQQVLNVMGQTKVFMRECLKLEFDDQTKGWLQYNIKQISDIIFKMNAKYGLTEINTFVNKEQ